MVVVATRIVKNAPLIFLELEGLGVRKFVSLVLRPVPRLVLGVD